METLFYRVHVDIFAYHKILPYFFIQKKLNLGQRQWLKLQKDYDVDILYHPRKENAVADSLSQRSMDSLSYLGVEKCQLAWEIH